MFAAKEVSEMLFATKSRPNSLWPKATTVQKSQNNKFLVTMLITQEIDLYRIPRLEYLELIINIQCDPKLYDKRGLRELSGISVPDLVCISCA